MIVHGSGLGLFTKRITVGGSPCHKSENTAKNITQDQALINTCLVIPRPQALRVFEYTKPFAKTFTNTKQYQLGTTGKGWNRKPQLDFGCNKQGDGNYAYCDLNVAYLNSPLDTFWHFSKHVNLGTLKSMFGKVQKQTWEYGHLVFGLKGFSNLQNV